MKKLDFEKDFLDYNWLKKGNVEVRCQNNRTIMNYLKIEKPNFETLRKWILDQHKNNSEKIKDRSIDTEEKNKINQDDKEFTNVIKKNGECTYRFIFDKSPTVEFKSKNLGECIKISRSNLIWKLQNELSSKINYKDYDNLSLFGGLFELVYDLSFAIGGTEILDDVDPLGVGVMFLLNQYILKNNLDVNTNKYALLRGLMQEILLVQSNLKRLRASLNTFHIMSILGFDYLFDIDSLCLYLETLINTISTGIVSYIEKLWRVVHDFSNEKDPKNIIKSELQNNNKNTEWITSLEEIYSIITCLHQKHKIKPPHIKNQSLNPGLYFNLYSDATTLFIVNNLRNAHIHKESPVSGADKEELNIQINEDNFIMPRYNLYYSIQPIKKGSIEGGFKNYLTTEGVDLSNPDDRDILYFRTKWRVPNELNEVLKAYKFPTLFTHDLPEMTHIELKCEIPGNNETLSYQEYKQKVLNINVFPIKDMKKTGFHRISLYNLSDCMWSLFDSLKRLLKAFLIKKLYNKEL